MYDPSFYKVIFQNNSFKSLHLPRVFLQNYFSTKELMCRCYFAEKLETFNCFFYHHSFEKLNLKNIFHFLLDLMHDISIIFSLWHLFHKNIFISKMKISVQNVVISNQFMIRIINIWIMYKREKHVTNTVGQFLKIKVPRKIYYPNFTHPWNFYAF